MEQRVVRVSFSGRNGVSLQTLNEQITCGWKVVQMQSYSECISVTSGYTKGTGDYGMVFVLERK